jgi:O-antigen ligase
MSELKPWQWLALVVGTGLGLFFIYSHLGYFRDVSFLGAILLIEVILACLWKFDQRFFILLMISFVWAGMNLPLQGAFTGGRWAVLAAGAVVGGIVWIKDLRRPFGTIHLLAVFCVFAAFISATTSPFVQMASFKALSLLLLFLYCASGARLAVIGREERFFAGLVWGSELTVYVTAACYFGVGISIWGNPNSLGAAMSIGIFPVLLWGWLTTEAPGARFRRLCALLLCTYLVFFSMARAGIMTISLVTLIFCFGLHQYKLLVRVVAIAVFMIAFTGMFAPQALDTRVNDFTDAVIYKGHKTEGVLGSRRSPWDVSVATIKEHPFFGTGYGTSPTGEDPGLGFGQFASSAETAREHGSSYMTITEWVGLLGVLPFVALLGLTLGNVLKVCRWMSRTSDPRHYSIPLAMVVLSGMIHAGFEDWLFAVGAYPSVYFWVFAFLLADFVPSRAAVPAVIVNRIQQPFPRDFGVVASDAFLSKR